MLNAGITRDYGLFEETYGLIGDAYVRAESRRRGLGAALVAHVEAWCRARGVDEVRVGVVVANELGVAFWRKSGFEPLTYTMSKSLAGVRLMSDHVLVWLLLEQDGAVLLGRRKADRPPFAGQWVLPGDEMPDEESASETLAALRPRAARRRSCPRSSSSTRSRWSRPATSTRVNIFRVAAGRPAALPRERPLRRGALGHAARRSPTPRTYSMPDALRALAGFGNREEINMKAVRVHEPGGLEVLIYEDVPTQRPGPARRSSASRRSASTSSTSTGARGLPAAAAGDAGPRRRRHRRRRSGDGVTEVKVGDRVGLYGNYGYLRGADGRPGRSAWSRCRTASALEARRRGAAAGHDRPLPRLRHVPAAAGPHLPDPRAAGGVGLLFCQIAHRARRPRHRHHLDRGQGQEAREAGADEVILYTRTTTSKTT